MRWFVLTSPALCTWLEHGTNLVDVTYVHGLCAKAQLHADVRAFGRFKNNSSRLQAPASS